MQFWQVLLKCRHAPPPSADLGYGLCNSKSYHHHPFFFFSRRETARARGLACSWRGKHFRSRATEETRGSVNIKQQVGQSSCPTLTWLYGGRSRRCVFFFFSWFSPWTGHQSTVNDIEDGPNARSESLPAGRTPLWQTALRSAKRMPERPCWLFCVSSRCCCCCCAVLSPAPS